MISTVTTSTVSTIAIAGSFVVIGLLVLLSLSIQKELVSGLKGERARRYSKLLNVAILPLLFAFLLLVVTKVSEVLR